MYINFARIVFKEMEKIIKIMIYKKSGNVELELLRIIKMFETNFNLTMGILFARQEIQYQSEKSIIHKDQYSCPGGECPDSAINKVIHYHMSHYFKTPLDAFESDALSYFDRILFFLHLIVLTLGELQYHY